MDNMYLSLILTLALMSLSFNDVTCAECVQYIDECRCEGDTLNCTGQGLIKMPSFLHYTGNKVVKKLLLNDNEITSLPKDAFKGLSVHTIDLSDNPLEHASNRAFDEMNTVRELRMDKCSLPTVPPAITEMTSLEKLSLKDNEITSLDKLVFQSLVNLHSLNLAGNKVQMISNLDSFDHLSKLEILDLSRNNLYSLPSQVLRGLGSLRVLNLEGNHIETLANNTFEKNRNLTKLHLKENPLRINSDNSATFDKLRKLELLEISHCSMDTIGPWFLHHKAKLRELAVSHCQLETIEPGIFDAVIGNLATLDVSGSVDLLPEVEKTLQQKGAGRLEKLTLASLNYSKVPTHLFKDKKYLIYLDLSNNSIQSIGAGAFAGIVGINVEIRLENNRINRVSPYMLDGTAPPLTVNLNNNSLVNINFIKEHPCNFDRSTIDLTGNAIKCDCTTAEVTQKKLVYLKGTCNMSLTSEFSGLQLAPLEGNHMKGEAEYLEEKAPPVCKLQNRVNEKFDCCNEKWVPVGTPISCPVKLKTSGSALLSTNSCLIWIILVANLLMNK